MTGAMDMRGDSRSVVRPRLGAGMSLGAMFLPLSFAAAAEAALQGHCRIVSAPGKPLAVVMLVLDLTQADVAALKTGVAPAAVTAGGSADIVLPVSLEEQVANLEKRLIQRALEVSGGNLSKAAVLLQATRRIVAYKAVQHGLIPASASSAP